MPAYAAKILTRWRVVHGKPPQLVRNKQGTPVDGRGHNLRSQAAAQARAINSGESGYKPRRPAAKAPGGRRRPIRKNGVGQVTLVWVAEGEVLEIPKGHNHRTALPSGLRNKNVQPNQFGVANRQGFFRGAVLNERLYVELDAVPKVQPTAAAMRSLATYCRQEGLRRGIVLEQHRARLNRHG